MIETYKTDQIGFCFGVKRAIAKALKELEKNGGKIHSLGPLVHNPQVVASLEEKGVIPIEDVRNIKNGVICYRSHGIEKKEEEEIRRKELTVIDAVCPFVKKVRTRALQLKRQGYTVVIVGDEKHPEVRSVLSYLDNDGIVMQHPHPIEATKIGVVCQTTQDLETLKRIVGGLMDRAEEIRVYNTICGSTFLRKQQAVDLAGRVEVMLVVGGRSSSNTTKLYHMVKKVQPRSYHIETEQDVKPEWFTGIKKVGITGGTSTPDSAIENVERLVKNL
ncbi:MAG TPA: 4-hydroxy-3-methylbut-2-enyl diphosphate reductase [Syntrophorhabdales bacterium]|nr:4-hydroxy-3-methylbut-2-enyl diphosphate reductase [Syntrophorhabdales bacterium]